MIFIYTHLNQRFGIELVGISSDGDWKLLAAMKREISSPDGIVVIQDTVHLGGKLRNKILNSDMPMGKYIVSVHHLKSLVSEVQKSVHGLTQNEIFPEDRMDFDSFLKITDNRVIKALRQYVENSDGTIHYLKLCQNLTSSFLDLKLAPLDRIFRMFRAVFFIRIWKQNIISSKSHKLKEFITPNAYTCIEINAKNLITLLKKFRNESHPQLFLPPIYDSQTCERFFRILRSMGTTQFTKINFSFYELIHMIGRVEVQYDIAYFKLKDTPIKFPNMRSGKTEIYDLPNDAEINETIAKAKEEAFKDAESLGMSFLDSSGIYEYNFQRTDNFGDDDDNETSDEEDTEENECNYREIDDDNTSELNEEKHSPYVVILDESGVERIVRKSTYLWMLTEEYDKLSNDRTKRFQGKKKAEKNVKKKDESKKSKKRKLD